MLGDKDRRRIYDVYGISGLDAGGRLAASTNLWRRSRKSSTAGEPRGAQASRGQTQFPRRVRLQISAPRTCSTRTSRGNAACSRRVSVDRRFLDLSGMDYNSVFGVPVTDDTTAYVGAQGQMSRGMETGGLILGLRRTVSPHTSWEAAAVTG